MVKYYFRADGNSVIGVGHIMRTLTIADALAKLSSKDEICFVCADALSAKVAEDRGYETVVLNTEYTDMDSELKAWEETCSVGKVVFVDSYYVTDSYLQGLRQFGKVVLLDDMQEQAFAADMVVNYNIFADAVRYDELYPGRKCFRLGADYIPIRPQFGGVQYEVGDGVSNVMITCGGGDSCNIAGQIYDILAGEHKGIFFHLISGVYNPFFEELKARESHGDLKVYHNVENMAEIMQKCDLAITAGGSTIYELAAIGVPLICFSYAHNQENLTEYMGRYVSDYAGAYDKQPKETLLMIKDLLYGKYQDAGYRRECSERERAMVDGKGAERIAEMILGLD